MDSCRDSMETSQCTRPRGLNALAPPESDAEIRTPKVMALQGKTF